MKNVFCVLLTVVMMLTLCACSAPVENTYKGTAEELDSLLLGISQIPVGTMGVSMTITARAVELLDWCETTSMSGDELAATVKAYYEALDDANKELFAEQIAVTMNSIGRLCEEDLRAGMLESAGLSTKLNWDATTFSLAASADDQL
ncbi:MAG: hypothetical protein E7553_06040 [Ruminococcaceae bacterium]|nr:hypothetical protein [Oscillospiraceae bacterium]